MHNKETILKHLKPLRQISFNRFYWWRNYSNGETPISPKSSIPQKIKAGYYSFPNAYFWSAQLSLIEIEEEIERLGSYDKMIELNGTTKNRYKRLIEDYHKDEAIKLERIYVDFTKHYIPNKDEVKKICEEFDGDITELYNFFEKNHSYVLQRTWKRSF
jgi:hypothetical protein